MRASLAHGNYTDLLHILMFYSCKRGLLSLMLTRNVIMLKYLIIQFLPYSLLCGCLGSLKKPKFKTFSSKSKTWLLTRDSKYSDLTWKLGKFVAVER